MIYSTTALRIVIVYRPISKSFGLFFFYEFPCLLEKLITASGCLVLIDDFNFHVDDKSDPAALKFPQLLLEVFNLR